MNILLHGMQSSGASLATYFLGQLPRSVCIVDLWSQACLPSLDDTKAKSEHVVAKCVVTMTRDLEDHIRSFKPDVKLLVLRHPLHNYCSLSEKVYRNNDGALDDKFRKLERIFQCRSSFDELVVYEDLAFRQNEIVAKLNSLEIPVKRSFFDFPRSPHDIEEYNKSNSAWCCATYTKEWGFGSLHGKKIRQRDIFKVSRPGLREHVIGLCPSVYDFMEDHYRRHVPSVRRMILTHPLNLVRRVYRRANKFGRSQSG